MDAEYLDGAWPIFKRRPFSSTHCALGVEAEVRGFAWLYGTPVGAKCVARISCADRVCASAVTWVVVHEMADRCLDVDNRTWHEVYREHGQGQQQQDGASARTVAPCARSNHAMCRAGGVLVSEKEVVFSAIATCWLQQIRQHQHGGSWLA